MVNWQHNGTSRSLSLAFTPTFIRFILRFPSFLVNLTLFFFPSFLFYVLPILPSFSFHSFSCFSLVFLPFFNCLLFNFRSFRYSFLLSFLYVSPSLFLYTSDPPGQHLSNIQDSKSTPTTVLCAPLCGSSRPSPRSGQSQIQADNSLHLVPGPLPCGTLSPMLPVRLHDTAVNPMRNFNIFVPFLCVLPRDAASSPECIAADCRIMGQ